MVQLAKHSYFSIYHRDAGTVSLRWNQPNFLSARQTSFATASGISSATG